MEKILEENKTIVQYYGIRKQLKKFAEEAYELEESVQDTFDRFFCDKDYIDHVAEELADVMVLWEQIRLYYDIPMNQVHDIMQAKISRQLKRMEDKKGK